MVNHARRQMMAMLLAGAATSTSSFPLLARTVQKSLRTALLVPLTGPSAAVGQSLSRAAAMAWSTASTDKADGLILLDTGSDAAGAASAAQQAMRQGAGLILGPLLSAETRSVVDTVKGGIPVLSFSNDEALTASGAYLMGLTPSQPISAILTYAARRGVRRVAVIGGVSAWSAQGVAAAERARSTTGLTIKVLATAPQSASMLLDAIRIGGELPDAVLATEVGPDFAATAHMVQGSGVQLLGCAQAIDPMAPPPAAMNAWLAGLAPAPLARFAQDYQARYSSPAGSIAALGYDAALIALGLRTGGAGTHDAMLSAGGFTSVTGALRFGAGRTLIRDLSIMVVGPDGLTPVAQSRST